MMQHTFSSNNSLSLSDTGLCSRGPIHAPTQHLTLECPVVPFIPVVPFMFVGESFKLSVYPVAGCRSAETTDLPHRIDYELQIQLLGAFLS